MNNHRNNRLLLLGGIALILVILPLVVTACDGYLDVKGTVYEWVDAPAGSNGEMYVNTAAPTGRMVKPVAGASVAFSTYSSNKPRLTTSENGTFAWSSVVAPQLRMVDVEIEKEGYHTIKGKFQRDRVNYSLVIFLVRQ